MDYIKCISICILGLILYRDVLHKLILDWLSDPNYSHGFIIPVFSLYLLWRRKTLIIELYRRKDPNFQGLIVITVGLMILVLGKAGSELFTQRFSIIIVIMGIVLLFFGKEMLKATVSAIVFLIFMIPLPYILYDSIAFPLKLLASDLATTTLTFFHIPVYREGNIIHLARTTLEVADACSGIRSLYSLFALGFVLAVTMLKGNIQRILLLMAVLPITVLANSSRVIGTGILAHKYGVQVAEGFFHEFAGLLIFIVSFVLLGLTCKLLSLFSVEGSS